MTTGEEHPMTPSGGKDQQQKAGREQLPSTSARSSWFWTTRKSTDHTAKGDGASASGDGERENSSKLNTYPSISLPEIPSGYLPSIISCDGEVSKPVTAATLNPKLKPQPQYADMTITYRRTYPSDPSPQSESLSSIMLPSNINKADDWLRSMTSVLPDVSEAAPSDLQAPPSSTFTLDPWHVAGATGIVLGFLLSKASHARNVRSALKAAESSKGGVKLSKKDWDGYMEMSKRMEGRMVGMDDALKSLTTLMSLKPGSNENNGGTSKEMEMLKRMKEELLNDLKPLIRHEMSSTFAKAQSLPHSPLESSESSLNQDETSTITASISELQQSINILIENNQDQESWKDEMSAMVEETRDLNERNNIILEQIQDKHAEDLLKEVEKDELMEEEKDEDTLVLNSRFEEDLTKLPLIAESRILQAIEAQGLSIKQLFEVDKTGHGRLEDGLRIQLEGIQDRLKEILNSIESVRDGISSDVAKTGQESIEGDKAISRLIEKVEELSQKIASTLARELECPTLLAESNATLTINPVERLRTLAKLVDDNDSYRSPSATLERLIDGTLFSDVSTLIHEAGHPDEDQTQRWSPEAQRALGTMVEPLYDIEDRLMDIKKLFEFALSTEAKVPEAPVDLVKKADIQGMEESLEVIADKTYDLELAMAEMNSSLLKISETIASSEIKKKSPKKSKDNKGQDKVIDLEEDSIKTIDPEEEKKSQALVTQAALAQQAEDEARATREAATAAWEIETKAREDRLGESRRLYNEEMEIRKACGAWPKGGL